MHSIYLSCIRRFVLFFCGSSRWHCYLQYVATERSLIWDVWDVRNDLLAPHIMIRYKIQIKQGKPQVSKIRLWILLWIFLKLKQAHTFVKNLYFQLCYLSRDLNIRVLRSAARKSASASAAQKIGERYNWALLIVLKPKKAGFFWNILEFFKKFFKLNCPSTFYQ